MAASDDEEDFAALFAASEEGRKRERRIAAGDVIRGRVIAVGATAAFVAVGGKAEATIDVGQRFRFRITKLEASGRNVVVSRRQLLDEEAAERARAVWAELRVGAVVGGTVSSVRDFGVFVDLGGVDGLIHVSELGHARVAHPSEMLQVGQRIEAQVVKLEPDPSGGRGRVGLSLRALAPDPWATAVERFPVGTN